MKLGQSKFQCGFSLLMHTCGDSTSVILNGARAVLIDVDVDLIRKSCHGLIDTVVHDLVHKVVETSGIGTADIHTGSLPYGLKTFQNDDAVRTVITRNIVPIHLIILS